MGQTYDQKRPGQEQLRTAAFNWFYMAVNVGALVSMFCLPLIRSHYILSHLEPEVRAQAGSGGPERRGYRQVSRAPMVLQQAYAVAFAFPAWLMVPRAGDLRAAGKRTYALERQEHHALTPEERRLQVGRPWRSCSASSPWWCCSGSATSTTTRCGSPSTATTST